MLDRVKGVILDRVNGVRRCDVGQGKRCQKLGVLVILS